MRTYHEALEPDLIESGQHTMSGEPLPRVFPLVYANGRIRHLSR